MPRDDAHPTVHDLSADTPGTYQIDATCDGFVAHQTIMIGTE